MRVLEEKLRKSAGERLSGIGAGRSILERDELCRKLLKRKDGQQLELLGFAEAGGDQLEPGTDEGVMGGVRMELKVAQPRFDLGEGREVEGRSLVLGEEVLLGDGAHRSCLEVHRSA